MSGESQYTTIIVNDCYGGFGYSRAALQEYVKRNIEIHGSQSVPHRIQERLQEDLPPSADREDDSDDESDDNAEMFLFKNGISRRNEIMIDVVKDLGSEKASARCASLVLQYVLRKYHPYTIVREYDGQETLCIDTQRYRIEAALAVARSNADGETRAREMEIILSSPMSDAKVFWTDPAEEEARDDV